MREPLEVLVCDAEGCGQQVQGASSQRTELARRAGWQVCAVTDLWVSLDDGPELERTDRCPAHPVEEIPRETILREAGGPGGIQPWHLA